LESFVTGDYEITTETEKIPADITLVLDISESMNEYIELSKEYSSDKSYQFINGVLNNVVLELKKNNTLFKIIKKQ
jgi:transcription termination factor NusB